MLKELCNQLWELKRKVELERYERAERMEKPDFKALSDQISECMAKQDAMLATVPDSSAAYATLHAQVMNEMEKQGIYAVGEVRAKFRESKAVNKEAVFRVIGGDVDQLFALADIPQVKLKAFAAEHPEMKRELLDTIEVTDRKLVDLAFEAPISPL